MSYTYLLAGENLELAEAELEGFLESQERPVEIQRNGRLAVAGEAMEGQLRRLALVQEVAEVIERGDIENLEIDYRPVESYAVRAIDVTDTGVATEEMEREVGEKLAAEGNEVNLENPEEELRVYLAEDEYILGRLAEDIDRGLFEKRSNENRSFSSPVSLDPVLARVLVNLSGVKPGEHLLDPFCGTGGILIEAGLCGVGVHGLDVKQEMVEGSRENLEEYGIISHEIRQGEIGRIDGIFSREFDAVVTDLPYGNASKVEGEPVKDFLDSVKDLAGGKTVFVYNEPELKGLKAEFQVYVHKNLTRYIYIL